MAKSAAVKSAANTKAQPAPQEREKPDLILRGTHKDPNSPGGYETTVLLFKAKEADYFTGFVVSKGVKHQVCVHINERKPDLDTGEVKPNFMVVSELNPETNEWNDLGYGNALNHRADNKKVYFDEVLFNIKGDVLKARVATGVSSELHRRLGFEHPREARPTNASKPLDQPSEPAPQRAPARMRAAR